MILIHMFKLRVNNWTCWWDCSCRNHRDAPGPVLNRVQQIQPGYNNILKPKCYCVLVCVTVCYCVLVCVSVCEFTERYKTDSSLWLIWRNIVEEFLRFPFMRKQHIINTPGPVSESSGTSFNTRTKDIQSTNMSDERKQNMFTWGWSLTDSFIQRCVW